MLRPFYMFQKRMFMTHFWHTNRNAVKYGFCKVKNTSKNVSKSIYILVPFWYNDNNKKTRKVI